MFRFSKGARQAGCFHLTLDLMGRGGVQGALCQHLPTFSEVDASSSSPIFGMLTTLPCSQAKRMSDGQQFALKEVHLRRMGPQAVAFRHF